MAFLHPKCFTPSHLNAAKKMMGAQDLLLLERCVLALELVGRLQQHGLNFIFKGGTSLLLLLPKPRRLSIDVDILCEESAKLSEVLEKVAGEVPFTGWAYQAHRERDEPPTRHYEVYFTSVVRPDLELAVLIDVIESENPYARVEEREIVAPFIEPLEPVRLRVPSLSSMLGDKLAAFAPGTIGYPYEPLNRRGEPDGPRPANVVKHLHDLGQLAALADNLEETLATYRSIHAEQCRWRGEHALEACLDDTQAAAVLVSQVEERRKPAEDPKIDFFRKGMNTVDAHMFAERFGRNAARIAGGRAALVAEAVRRGRMNLRTISIQPGSKLEGDWFVLERLRKTDNTAYVLWQQAQALRNGSV